MTITAAGELNQSVFPVARAFAKVGGATLGGITLGTDMSKLIVAVNQGASLSTKIHHGALVITDIFGYGGLHPAAKPLRWLPTAAHVWDDFTRDVSDRIFGNKQ